MWQVGTSSVILSQQLILTGSRILIEYLSNFIFSLTHKNNDDKEYIIVTWTKPEDYDGQDLYLRYTIVTEKRQYWVGLEYPPREEVTAIYDDLGFRIEK